MLNQVFEKVMGTKHASLYACLAIDYYEKTTLFTTHKLPKYFSEEFWVVKKVLKRNTNLYIYFLSDSLRF